MFFVYVCVSEIQLSQNIFLFRFLASIEFTRSISLEKWLLILSLYAKREWTFEGDAKIEEKYKLKNCFRSRVQLRMCEFCLNIMAFTNLKT